jgi:hypothetical protein
MPEALDEGPESKAQEEFDPEGAQDMTDVEGIEIEDDGLAPLEQSKRRQGQEGGHEPAAEPEAKSALEDGQEQELPHRCPELERVHEHVTRDDDQVENERRQCGTT